MQASAPTPPFIAGAAGPGLSPAAPAGYRHCQAMRGIASVMSADDQGDHALFMSSSGSPGSWPSWATDIR
jgi:hypothetical protein